MINHPTIIKYLALKFSWYLFLTSLVTIIIFFVTNAFDIIQNYKSIYVSPENFWLLIFLKIPFLFNETSSIISFISTILFLRYLSSSNELVIILSSGLASWRVFAAPIIISFLFGIITITMINPLSAFGLSEIKKIEAKLYNVPTNNLVISTSGIFFHEKYHDTNRIIQAKSINTTAKSISDITIFIVDEQNSLIERIDSPSAILKNDQFELIKPTIATKDNSYSRAKLFLPTNLSINNLIQRFKPPEMISIWSLPESIDKIDNSGLPTLNYQLHFFKQLFKPLSIVAMVLIACWFLNLNNRDNSSIKNIIFSLVIGLFIYFALEITLRILAYSGLSPVIAALFPILFVILISNFVILHFQEA